MEEKNPIELELTDEMLEAMQTVMKITGLPDVNSVLEAMVESLMDVQHQQGLTTYVRPLETVLYRGCQLLVTKYETVPKEQMKGANGNHDTAVSMGTEKCDKVMSPLLDEYIVEEELDQLNRIRNVLAPFCSVNRLYANENVLELTTYQLAMWEKAFQNGELYLFDYCAELQNGMTGRYVVNEEGQVQPKHLGLAELLGQ